MSARERTVAALYVDPRGPYLALLGADMCWDEKRDARLYEGPWPVVAHPPCGPWSKQRHNYRGNEHDCALRAVEQVRKWGGVLEQPAGSLLWDACGIELPVAGFATADDVWGGFSVEVEQVNWGHVARKKTWLYLVGVDRDIAIEMLAGRSGAVPTHWCSGGRKRSKGSGGLVPPGIKVCSAQQRRRTPPAFADLLIALAMQAPKRHEETPMAHLSIVAYGTPAPKGSKRGFFNQHTKRVSLVESSSAEKPWRQDVAAAALAARNGAPPLDGPLVLRLVFTMPKPKSAPKSRRTWPDRKPDIDKLQRSVLDALVSAGAIADDARVVEVSRCAKVFPGEDPEALEAPGVRIDIATLGFRIADAVSA